MRTRTILPLLLLTPLLMSLALSQTARMQQRGVGGVGTPPATVAAGRSYALVIGNNAYAYLPKLKTAEADAREVAALLKDFYGFETKLLLNATRGQIVSALSAYRRTLEPEANLLIYYAGHGVNDKDADKAYWLPVDAIVDDNSNWIIADEITTALKVIPAKHVLIVSDSCYSGALTRGLGEALPRPTERERFLKRMAAGHSRTLMASGGDEPVADGGGGGHSVFANALLRGLREMDKAQFTAAELFRNFIEESVAGRTNQTPEYTPLRNSGHESGDFIFVRVGGETPEATVKSAPLPSNPGSHGESKSAKPDMGRIQNSVYTNDHFGIRLPIPVGWNIHDDASKQRLTQSGLEQLASANPEAAQRIDKSLPQALNLLGFDNFNLLPNGGGAAALNIVAEPIAAGQTPNGAQFLKTIKQLLITVPGYEMVQDIHTEMIGGVECGVMTVKRTTPEGTIKQKYIGFSRKGYAISLVTTYTNEEAGRSLDDILKKSKLN